MTDHEKTEVPDLARFVAILLQEDDRFQVWIGGNPYAVDKMLDEARAALDRARSKPREAA